MIRVTPQQILAYRIGRHHLDKPSTAELAGLARDVCGIQAQVAAAAQLSLGVRAQNLAPEQVERALWEERTLVKTWCQRGTVHLLAVDDLPIYTQALQQSGTREIQRWLGKHGLQPQVITRLAGSVVEALDNKPVTRRELADRLIAIHGPEVREWIAHSWGGVVKYACMSGQVCFGPGEGVEVGFVRRDRWLPNLPDISVAQAEELLLQRYLHSYGPAQPQDFAAWSGIPMREVTPIWSRLSTKLADVEAAGQTYALLRSDLEALQQAAFNSPSVCLLPHFDSYMLGHRDKALLVDAAHYKAVYRKAGWIAPVILCDGRAVGTWSHERRGARLVITVAPFTALPDAVITALEERVQALGRWFGSSVDLKIETISK